VAKTKKKPPVHEAVEGIDKFDGHAIEKDESATVVHAFKLGRDAGLISVSEYKGKKSLDIRRWYLGEDERWHPTSKGIRVPEESSSALLFLEALHQKQTAILALLNS
jgi:Transcriptional Coactivator p15 (PC4).